MHLVQLALKFAAYDDLRSLVLLDDVLGQVDHRLGSLAHEAFKARFEVDVEDVDLLAS